MRLLHSADWQLGLLPRQVEAGTVLRDQRFTTARRIMDLAKSSQADLVVLAGDTFDSPDIDESQLREALEIFDDLAPVPIFLLPGNHDPWQAGSVWTRRAWRQVLPHVEVLNEAKEIVRTIGGQELVLYPCPLSQKKSRLDPTAWIPPRVAGDRRLRLGVAHGSLTTLGVRASFPIDARRAELAGLDYLALGDWHGLQQLPRTAYPGAPEATGFGEQNPGHVLIVDLHPGEKPKVEAVRVARFWWRSLERSLADETDLAQLRAEILHSADLEDGILKLKLDLRSAVSIPEHEIEDLRADLGSRLFELHWNVDRSEAATQGNLPPGLAEEVDRLLLLCTEKPETPGSAELKQTYDRQIEPEVAREARRLLHRIVAADEEAEL